MSMFLPNKDDIIIWKLRLLKGAFSTGNNLNRYLLFYLQYDIILRT